MNIHVEEWMENGARNPTGFEKKRGVKCEIVSALLQGTN